MAILRVSLRSQELSKSQWTQQKDCILQILKYHNLLTSAQLLPYYITSSSESIVMGLSAQKKLLIALRQDRPSNAR